jgi:predicted nucleotidyltransferase
MTDPDIKPPADAATDPGPALSGDEVRDRVVRLAFDGDWARYDRFIATLRESIPPDVTVILRGSAVTGYRWHTDIPFDADGKGTSDLDLTFVSSDMVKLFDVHYIPGLHTAPLSEAHPDASATLHPLRSALCAIAQRPVNIQATSNLLQFVRDVVMNQPYFLMIDPDADGAR